MPCAPATGSPAQMHDKETRHRALEWAEHRHISAKPYRFLWVLCAAAVLVSGVAIAKPPPIHHVFMIVLENEGYTSVTSPRAASVYLGRKLPRHGALLTRYYAVGHASLDNYIAMISGQPPNANTQYDCLIFNDFVVEHSTLNEEGIAIGRGCIYPFTVKTLADQLEAKGLTWRAYMEDMGNDSKREAATCGHSAVGAVESSLGATIGDQYAARHNPFIYFHSLIDDQKRCDQHVVPLTALPADLAHAAATPNFVFITPNLCHDGHDAPCVDAEPGGLWSIDRFLRSWVPAILQSAAFKKDGLLIVTFDEGEDSAACCGERPLAGSALSPGISGPGGGRIATVLVSPFIRPGTRSAHYYNHYSLLRSIEDIFALSHLAYAAPPQLRSFGTDVYTRAARQ